MSSFTSAATFPTKLLTEKIVQQAKNQAIQPIHVQLNPTNKCNLKCAFCSCANRDKEQEMSINKAIDTIRRFKQLGCKACTITGGGEPLMHPQINEIIKELNKQEIEIGLTTNGLLLDKVNYNNKMTWCRISLSSTRTIQPETIAIIKANTSIDWAFSIVLEKRKSLKPILEMIKIANDLNLTHVRIVDDILENNSRMDLLKELIQTEQINDNKVIYQPRQNYTTGHKSCLISLLKPNIAPDGHVYPCCGVQYARKALALDFDEIFFDMGDDYETIWQKQAYFNGSICDKCFYSNYNDLLNIIWGYEALKHKKFV